MRELVSSRADTDLLPQSPEATRPIGPRDVARTTSRWTAVSLAGLLVLYVAVRAAVWKRTVLLEDHDSLGYLRDLANIRALDFHLLTPDSNPVYPLAASLFSLLPGSDITAARLCSLAFAVLLFAALWGIGRRLAGAGPVLVGLLLLSISPLLSQLSIGVLAEPTYIGIVYAGLWLFWTQFRSPTVFKAAMLGAVFALAFLTRVEGLLFLGFIPLLQAGALAAQGALRTGLRTWATWTAAFVTLFVLVAAPQVLRVSSQMGEFALNGRQVWSAVVSLQDDRSIEEKLRSLDYSPTEINLFYLQSNPEARRDLGSGVEPARYLSRAMLSLDGIVHERVGRMIGPLAFALFVFGVLALFRRGRRFEVGVILAFLGAALVGPLVQDPLLDRHLAVAVPVVLLLAGVGAVELARQLTADPRSRHLVAAAVVAAVLGSWLVPLRQALRPPHDNWEYSPARIAGPVEVIRQQHRSADGHRPRVAIRRAYVAHFADAQPVILPFTDLDGLVAYLDAQMADFLYLEHKHVSEHPFLADFQDDVPPERFELLYRASDEVWGDRVELYRFRPRMPEAAPEFAPWSTAWSRRDRSREPLAPRM
jgi:hypothetical protein